jgi:O-antigen biosynthesis protein WbqV
VLKFLETGRINILRIGSMVLDLAIAAGSFLAAYGSVYGFERLKWVPGLEEKTAAYTVICGACFMAFGVNKGSWRYVSILDLLALIKSAVIAIGI